MLGIQKFYLVSQFCRTACPALLYAQECISARIGSSTLGEFTGISLSKPGEMNEVGFIRFNSSCLLRYVVFYRCQLYRYPQGV